MLKKLIFVIALIVSFPSYAENGNGEVARIYPDSGKVYFRLKSDSCQPSGYPERYYYFNLNSDTAKAWYTLLLSSAATKKKITVSVPDCSSTSSISINYLLQDY